MSTDFRLEATLTRASRTILVVLLALNLGGCLTIDRLIRFTEKPQVYGGTRTHIYPSVEDFNREITFGPGLEFADPVVTRIGWGIDLPFSFVADTLLLPVTIPLDLLYVRDEPAPEEPAPLLATTRGDATGGSDD